MRARTGDAAAVLLAAGIVALEFAAAVTSFVASTLLPVVAVGLEAHNQLGLLIAGSTLGVFVALPLASRVLDRWGTRRTLGAGIVGYVGGLVLAATATEAWMFALGQFVGGLASGLLAVFGVSSAIRHLDERLRIRVVAASSAMWILPALVGPAATLGLEHVVGWRWTLLVPVPVVLVGRLLVVRAVGADSPSDTENRPLGRTFLIPVGAAGVVFNPGWPLAVLGAAVALVGVVTIMPVGTARLRAGTPAALAAMLLFAFGYFGADSLITVLLTAGYRVGLGQAAVVLSAAPLAWALTSLVVARFTSRRGMRWFPVVGMTTSAVGVAVVAVNLVAGSSFVAGLIAWAFVGIGVGLAYPSLYIRSTSGSGEFGAATLATAVITAEAFGGLLGRAVGGAISSLDDTTGLLVSYLLFAIALAAAAMASTRT